MWQLVFTRQARKDLKKINQSQSRKATERLLETVQANPYHASLSFEKLTGDLAGAYSRRINIQHRLVYEIMDDEKIVKIIRLWGHYD